MKTPAHKVLAFQAVCCFAAAAFAGESSDPLARLRSLEKIQDATTIEAECRALLNAALTPEQRAAVYKALCGATQGDKRIEVLQSLPAEFPEQEGLSLFVTGIRDSEAYRSLDYYKLMLARYGDKVTAELVDRAARPLLNERRDWIGGAEAVVTAALERFPGDSRLLDILADTYRRSRRGKESLDLQRQALANAKTPELRKAMYEGLARNLRLQRMDAEALQVSYDIIREWPDHDWARQALDSLALARLRGEGMEPARKVYQWYIETFPQGKWVEHCHLSLPLLYQLDGQYDQAAEELGRIRALVGARAQRDIDHDLKGLPSLEGQVLDPAGEQVAGATVTLARRSPIREEGDRHILARTKSDAKGRYAFRNLAYHTQYEFLAATKPDDPTTCLSTTFGPKEFPLEF
ncbi:MAG: carboxypeptidase-like regulatory domain-containing protein, partial [Planctomycetota bacterium]